MDIFYSLPNVLGIRFLYMIYDNVDCGYDGHCVNSTEKIKILCLCTSVTSYLFSTQNLIECFSNGPSGVCTIPHIQGLALRRPVIEHLIIQ